MGKVVTPKYRLELEVPGHVLTAFAWEGRANAKRLGEYVRALNATFDIGGANHAAMQGAKVRRAWLVRQADNLVIADYMRDRGAWGVVPYEFHRGGALPNWDRAAPRVTL